MSTTLEPEIRTLHDFVRDLGDIPLTRIRWHPHPGTADESHLLAAEERDGYFCELVDGTLVEKPVGYMESTIASVIIGYLQAHMMTNNLGAVSGEQGMMRLGAGLVRGPDVAFTRWSKMPGGRLPRQPIPDLVPCLAVEVISASNTGPEMERKRREYFTAGTELVWMVDPAHREVRIHTAPEIFTTLREGDTLDGGTLLPGLSIPVSAIFDGLAPEA
jgi:Uma2 family endonuclease